MILDDVVTYLNAMGAGSVLWPIYEAFLPDDSDQAVAMFEAGGYPPETMERECETVSIQLRVRGSKLDYGTARAKWLECFNLLQDAQASAGSPHLLPGVVFIIGPSGPMTFLDPKGRPNFTTTFRVKRYR